MHPLGREDRFICSRSCFVAIFGEDFDRFYMFYSAWNEMSSQGAKTHKYCITECCRCSDEGAIGLETW